MCGPIFWSCKDLNWFELVQLLEAEERKQPQIAACTTLSLYLPSNLQCYPWRNIYSYIFAIMSSTDEKESLTDEVCASCGIAAIDNITLKKCACNLVKYCSVDCQKNHRPQHKKACKKRMAELHDDELFTQPDISHLGECPLCCLPLSNDQERSTMMGCCSKIICRGCDYANAKREIEAGLEQRCAFCREPAAESQEESDKRIMNRIKKNDPLAMTNMAKKHALKGDYGKAAEYLTKAAGLGETMAHFCLGDLYQNGVGVEKDMKKAVYHLEQAAIGGHPQARGFLAAHEMENGKIERATKHLIIAANLGCNDNLKFVKNMFVQGMISKEDYAAALRGYQAAVDATKSQEREKAEGAKIR
jgi:hypothetical protein